MRWRGAAEGKKKEKPSKQMKILQLGMYWLKEVHTWQAFQLGPQN